MSSFHERLEACLPDLWRFAFSLCRDRALADDLVQDCAERALRKRALLLPGRPLRPWLMKMLLNIFRNQMRRDRKLRAVPLDGDALERHEEFHVAPAGGDRLELAEMARSLARLPAQQREALLAVVVGGLDYAGAARALDIPVGTLMSRISRARAKLRQGAEGGSKPPLRSVR